MQVEKLDKNVGDSKHIEEGEENLIQSTTLKTIRNMKIRQSLSNLQQGKENNEKILSQSQTGFRNGKVKLRPQTREKTEIQQQQQYKNNNHNENQSNGNDNQNQFFETHSKLKFKKSQENNGLVSPKLRINNYYKNGKQINGDDNNIFQHKNNNTINQQNNNFMQSEVHKMANGKQNSIEIQDEYDQQSSKQNMQRNSMLVSQEQATNVEEREIESPNKKKKTIKMKSNIFGALNQPQELPERMEYFNINMERAIDFVLSKSKMLKEFQQEQEISEEFLNKNIIQNHSFNIKYNSFLQKMVNMKQMNHEFKNVQKKTFDKLEKFFFNNIKKVLTDLELDKQYFIKSKQFWDIIEQRSKELKMQLQEEKHSAWNYSINH